MKLSLRKKIIIVLVVFAVLLSSVAAFVSWRTISRMSDRQYKNRADELAATIARVIQVEDAKLLRDRILGIYRSSENKVSSEDWGSEAFDAYVAHFAGQEETEEFRRLLQQLRTLQEVNSVDCLYLIWVEPADEAWIYLVDAALEDPCPPGVFDPLYEFNKPALENPKGGFPAYITNTEEYGWLVTAAAAVLDEEGQIACYAAVDISMDAIKAQQHEFITTLIAALMLLTVCLCVLVIGYVNRYVIRPVNQLSEAALRYRNPETKERTSFETLNIHTGDELESLQNSMIQMEKDIDTYIENLVQTRAQLKTTRMEAEQMNELAHKDALTGLGNKLAYDKALQLLNQELKQGRTAFGVAVIDLNDLKKINDAYGHDCGSMSLRQISSLICNTFVHSPVFRIGGDEFTVVLRGNDYDRIEELVSSFYAAQSELAANPKISPWDRVSAALGYALYDARRDHSAEDVFRRADEKMYEQKKQMKARRTDGV